MILAVIEDDVFLIAIFFIVFYYFFSCVEIFWYVSQKTKNWKYLKWFAFETTVILFSVQIIESENEEI